MKAKISASDLKNKRLVEAFQVLRKNNLVSIAIKFQIGFEISHLLRSIFPLLLLIFRKLARTYGRRCFDSLATNWIFRWVKSTSWWVCTPTRQGISSSSVSQVSKLVAISLFDEIWRAALTTKDDPTGKQLNVAQNGSHVLIPNRSNTVDDHLFASSMHGSVIHFSHKPIKYPWPTIYGINQISSLNCNQYFILSTPPHRPIYSGFHSLNTLMNW